MRALARSLVRDEGRADDLLQDVWLKVVSSPPRTVRSVRAWLTRVLVNRHRDVHRSERARAEREAGTAPRRDAPSTADLVARVDAQQRVAAAVLELEEPQRETVLLRFFEDLSVREIGRRTCVPYETARARLAKGLSELRARLGPRDARGERQWSLGFLALAGLDGTFEAAATGATSATLTGVVVAMKQKIAALAAILVLLVAGVAGWQYVTAGRTGTAPQPAPEEVVALPVEAESQEAASGAPATVAPVAAAASATAGDSLDPERGTCHGRITHEDGTPAAGVQVRLSGRPARVAVTDAEGRFRIVNEWVDPSGRVLYVGPKTGLMALGNVPLRAGEDLEFDATLPAGLPIPVEVVSAVDGRPLAGVWVCIHPLAEPDWPNALCVTDENGKGGLAALPPRDYRVYIASQGFRPYRERLDLTAGPAPKVLRIRLEDPEELRVRVVPPPAGKKYVNVSLIPVPEDPVQGQFFNGGDLDGDGVFTGVAPPPGRYRAHIQIYDVARWTVQDIVVREREPLELTVRMKTGAEVRGTLVGPDGKPLRGRVTLTPQLPDPDGADRNATTNEKGEFRIAGVPPCTAWVDVRVGGQTLSAVLRELTVPAEGLPDLEIRLPAGGVISGVVTGSPLPNAHFVNFCRRTEEGWDYGSSMATDRHGRFRARFLPAGEYFVRVNPHRAEQGWARDVRVEVREGEEARPVEIAWRTCPTVGITVTAADGAPVSGAIRVMAMPEGGATDSPPGGMLRRFDVTLDGQGQGVMRALAAERFRVTVTADGRSAAKSIEVQESRNPTLEIRLPR